MINMMLLSTNISLILNLNLHSSNLLTTPITHHNSLHFLKYLLPLQSLPISQVPFLSFRFLFSLADLALVFLVHEFVAAVADYGQGEE